MNYLKIKTQFFIYFALTAFYSPHLFASDQLPDSSSKYIIKEIITDGNKITKRSIILRELTFSTGDTLAGTILEEKIEKSRENLLNTTLFNFVTFRTVPFDENNIYVIITLDERWYIWPNPIFEHADRNLSAFFMIKTGEKLITDYTGSIIISGEEEKPYG